MEPRTLSNRVHAAFLTRLPKPPSNMTITQRTRITRPPSTTRRFRNTTTTITRTNRDGPVHRARSQYDYSTALPAAFKDENGIITQTFYEDPFARPTLIKSALGIAGVESHTAMYYAPTTAFGITLSNDDVLTA